MMNPSVWRVSAFWIAALLAGVALSSCSLAQTFTQVSITSVTNTALPTRTSTASATPAPTPTVTSTPNITITIRSIQMMDLTTGWAHGQVGADKAYRLLRTMDGGTTWRDVSPSAYSLYDQRAFFLDSQSAWMVVADANQLWHTPDGGQTWTSVEQTRGSHLWFNDSQHGWKMEATAWGLSFVQFDIDSFSTTQDGGQTWDEKNPPPDWGVAFLAFPEAQLGWGVRAGFAKVIEGFPNLGVPFFLETTTDGAQTWQSRAIPLPPGTERVGREGAYYLDAGNCDFDAPVYSSTKIWKLALMCEAQGWVYTTINRGQTWIISPLPAGQGIDVQFINPTVGWLFSKTKLDRSPGQLYQTTDGGQTWTLLGGTAWVDARLDFLDAQTGWVVACLEAYCNSSHPPTLVKTTDGGQTWQTLQPGLAP